MEHGSELLEENRLVHRKKAPAQGGKLCAGAFAWDNRCVMQTIAGEN